MYATREEIAIKDFEKAQKKQELEKKKAEKEKEDVYSASSDVRKRKNPNYKRVQVTAGQMPCLYTTVPQQTIRYRSVGVV